MTEISAFDQIKFKFKNSEGWKNIIIDFFKNGINITAKSKSSKQMIFLTRNQLRKISDKYE